jgi:hypothetical protein
MGRIERMATMNRTFYGKVWRYSVFCLALTVMMFQFPAVSRGEDSLGVDVSPNIINIASERNGEIRIWTNMRYSSYIKDTSSYAHVFFNGSDTVENIRATSDSLGNLILKFDLEDLLDLGDFLILEEDNNVKVVVVVFDSENTGYSSVYIVGKKASDKTSAK